MNIFRDYSVELDVKDDNIFTTIERANRIIKFPKNKIRKFRYFSFNGEQTKLKVVFGSKHDRDVFENSARQIFA